MESNLFYKKVREMRKAQRDYNNSGNSIYRELARSLEKEVDKLIEEEEKAKLPKQKSIF